MNASQGGGALARVLSWFVLPAPAAQRNTIRSLGAGARLAVVGSGAAVPSLACALGVALAARTSRPAATVALCGAAPPAGWATRRAALLATRRLVGQLAAGGVEAWPTGRLARVVLPADPEQAVAAAERADIASGEPLVVAIAGPRPAALDHLLRRQDAIVIAPDTAGQAGDLVAEVAQAGLVTLGPPVVTCRLATDPVTRNLAASGWLATPAVRRSLAPALDVELVW